MNTFFALILLQFNFFGNSHSALTNSKIYLESATSDEEIAMVKVGQSGQFLFSYLDPGSYQLYLEIPENVVLKVDKKDRQKYDTDIEMAYNKKTRSYLWQHPEGFVKVNFSRKNKLADEFMPLSERMNQMENKNDSTALNFIFLKKADIEHLLHPNKDQKVKILQFTVIGEWGSIGGNVQSITQKEFHQLTVGKDEETLENQGRVSVLKRYSPLIKTN
ncbi:MAG: hypothetical protein ACERKD_12800 [Prolixibacteraceae bacterium]